MMHGNTQVKLKDELNLFLLYSNSESGLIEGWKIQVGGINSTGHVDTG
jgi:hypothetical protein